MTQESGGGSQSQVQMNMNDDIRKLCTKLAQNFYFGDPRNPSFFDNGAIKPKFFVNVFVKLHDKPVNVMFETAVLKNILGNSCPEDGVRNANGSLRFKISSAKDLNKLINTKEVNMNGAVFSVDAVSDKKMNNGRGIFYCRDINDVEVNDILRWTEKHGVTEIYAFTKKDEKKTNPDGSPVFVRTGLYKATFNSSFVPHKMSVFCLMVPVNLFFDKPMYCYRCGMFGHTKKTCRNCEDGDKCLRCTSNEHKTDECFSEMKCINCGGEHDMKPINCPIYDFEKEIIRYSTLAQLPQGRVRRQAIDKIKSYVAKLSEQSTFSQQVAMNEIDATPTNEPWYRPVEQRTKARGKPKNVEKNVEATDKAMSPSNYFDSYSQPSQKRPRVSDSSQPLITPRDRVEKIDAAGKRETVSYHDVMNSTPSNSIPIVPNIFLKPTKPHEKMETDEKPKPRRSKDKKDRKGKKFKTVDGKSVELSQSDSQSEHDMFD